VLNSGDIQALLDTLAPDVVLVADGGGEVAGVRLPVEGADSVANFLSGFTRVAPDADIRIVWLNGAPAMRVDLDGELNTAVSLVIEGGRISRIYAVRNPEEAGRARRRAAAEPDPMTGTTAPISAARILREQPTCRQYPLEPPITSGRS